MKTKTIIDKLKERTVERVREIDQLESTVRQIESAMRGGATNLEALEKQLGDMKTLVKDMRQSMLAGIGHLKETDLESIVNKYKHDATFIYNIIDVWARLDPDLFIQIVTTAEPETRRQGWGKISPELRKTLMDELRGP